MVHLKFAFYKRHFVRETRDIEETSPSILQNHLRHAMVERVLFYEVEEVIARELVERVLFGGRVWAEFVGLAVNVSRVFILVDKGADQL